MSIHLNTKPKLIAFDVDGTLVDSGHELLPEFAELFQSLVQVMRVAFLSGRSLVEIHKITDQLSLNETYHNQLYALPMCGTAMHVYEGEWREIYMHNLPEEEQQAIESVFVTHIFGSHFLTSKGDYSQHLRNKGSQFTFVAFELDTSIEDKRAWDPTREKREKIKQVLEEHLPEHSSVIGGHGAIDITKKGMDKGFGIRELARHTGIKEEEIIFVGDMLFPGGNDYPVLSTDAHAVSVNGPEDTLRFIKELLEG